MQDQDKLAALYAALSRAVAKAQAVAKGSENSFHRYKYASAEALIEESRGCLAAEGICVMPISWALSPHQGDSGHFANVVVTYRVAHSSGGSVDCSASTPAIREKGRPEDKAVATALTYSLGYFLRSLLLLPRVDAEHDVDQRDDRPRERADRRQRPPNSPGRDDRAETAQRSAYDVEKVIAAIRAANDDDVMQMIANDISENAPEKDRPRLRGEWGKRKREIIAARVAA
jgi:hypothetical protein